MISNATARELATATSQFLAVERTLAAYRCKGADEVVTEWARVYIEAGDRVEKLKDEARSELRDAEQVEA